MASFDETEELASLEGTVENVVFHNEQTGFTVIEVSSNGILHTVVGMTNDIQPGESVKATGRFGTHASYGPQFQAKLIERQMPATANAILRYLSSGAVKGIGPVTAKKLVDAFGSKTLEIMEKEPNELLRVKGMTKSKVEQISKEVSRIFGMRTVMLFLSNYGISPSESVCIWNKWGMQTPQILLEDPFALCQNEIGIAFERADQIRLAAGLEDFAPCRVRGGLSYILNKNISSGHACLPEDKLCQTAAALLKASTDQVEAELDDGIDQREFVRFKANNRTYIYLSELYHSEGFVASRLALAIRAEAAPFRMEQELERLEKNSGISYDEVQRAAIFSALTQGVTVITGGPGTGKTTTVNAILALLEQQNLRVALAAPTGRAAKRMSQVTGKDAKTIHRLLEANAANGGKFQFLRNAQNPLDLDVLIVDEMSMVDIQLMEHLLSAAPLDCRFVFVGDHHQLPSVGAGNVLRDMIASGRIPVVTLQKIFRQAQQSAIVTNAHRIIRGEQPDLKVRDKDFFFLSSPNPVLSAKTVCDLCARRLPTSYGFSPLWDIQVIAPSKLGEVGTFELNARLQEILNPAADGKVQVRCGSIVFRRGDKVMQNRNNYDVEIYKTDTGEVSSGVFNGDIGVIEEIDRKIGVMQVHFEDKVAQYALDDLFQLDLAYAITVHKSQGSEFEAVVLPLLPSHKNLYYRNLFYTAVTRAKRLLVLVGREETVINMVNNDRKSRRFSNLARLLQDEIPMPEGEETALLDDLEEDET